MRGKAKKEKKRKGFSSQALNRAYRERAKFRGKTISRSPCVKEKNSLIYKYLEH